MSYSKKTFFYLICVAFLHLLCEGAITKLEAHKVNLPESVGNWTRSDTPREINSENIFAYMNGAGELYLAYRFQHLDVFEYTFGNQNNIVVELFRCPPEKIGSAWELRKDRMSFFRSHLVLNSIYYLSEKDILDLDLSAEAVMAPYETMSSAAERKRSQLLLIKYEDRERARNALTHFHKAYLPEYSREFTTDSTHGKPILFELEDGWLGYKLIGNYVAIVFECPDQESAGTIIEKTEPHLMKKGKDHEKK